MTKWGGMRHVWYYYTEYHKFTLEEARELIHINKPFANASCMRCHSTQTPIWNEVNDHHGLRERVRSGEVSCASKGCHGPAHPFSKSEGDQRAEVVR
jgi:cytochrome c-type protein NapC